MIKYLNHTERLRCGGKVGGGAPSPLAGFLNLIKHIHSVDLREMDTPLSDNMSLWSVL